MKNVPKGATFGNDILSYMLNSKAMNDNIDLVRILKNVTIGTKLWSPICGDCYFKEFREGSCNPIVCEAEYSGDYLHTICFTKDGRYDFDFVNGECVLFPSETNHDWSTFKVPNKHKHFEPFQKVLVKELIGSHCEKSVWLASEYSHYDEDLKRHYCTQCYGFDDNEIIPYEDNEDKLGKPIE